MYDKIHYKKKKKKKEMPLFFFTLHFLTAYILSSK